MALAATRSTRRVIYAAARREKVSSRMRRGSAPLTIRCPTRCASVLVLPEPAPAMTSSGAAPCSTARRCCGLSRARYASAIGRRISAGDGPISQHVSRLVRNLDNGWHFVTNSSDLIPRVRALCARTSRRMARGEGVPPGRPSRRERCALAPQDEVVSISRARDATVRYPLRRHFARPLAQFCPFALQAIVRQYGALPNAGFRCCGKEMAKRSEERRVGKECRTR